MYRVNLEGRVALVTGAGGGIGSATARAFAEAGAGVLCTDVSEAVLAVAEEIRGMGGKAAAVVADISQPGSAVDAVSASVSKLGRLDVLANIAGAGGTGVVLLEQPQELWDRMLLVNLTATMWMCRAALPIMIEQGRGSVINTSSVTGLQGSEGSTAYAAAKAGVIGFSKALARETARHRINVNVVAPGLVDTPMSRARGTMNEPNKWVIWPRVGTPDDCASLYLFLASDAAEFITGQVISPNGGGFM